ncbi:MAG: hypothetical protein U9R53_09705 [Chloroflexota bacterium]|nr:hypothetical protein [Chloroflexota bacterium]
MKSQSKYEINPDIIWVNESKGQIAVVIPNKKGSIRLKGFDAAMWRSIWQGISPLMWERQVEEQGKNAMEILTEWINAGLITMVES